MATEQNVELGPVLDEVHERMQAIGLSDQRITVAVVGALVGGKVVLEIHGSPPEILQTVYKADAGQTPRTIADLNSAAAIKGLIRREFPDSRINEEETGDEKGTDETDWHVDSLDGTSSYAEMLRYSTVGIAIYRSGLPFASAIVNPFEKELIVTQAGKGTFLFPLDKPLDITNNGEQIYVSKTKTLEGGLAFIDALFNDKTSQRKFGFMADLVKLANNNLGFRMSGSNIDQQLKVAAGRARLTLTDAVGGFFDLAAGGLAIIEAGGKFTDQNGKPVDETTQVAFGSNGLIHDNILEIASKHYKGYQGFK